MPALGHKQTFRSAIGMSALPPKADIGSFGFRLTQTLSCLSYILGPASGMVIALEEICA